MSTTALHVWAPGINCQRELGVACEMVGIRVEVVHIRELMRDPGLVAAADLICFPGGFSYGDDVASGKILAVQLRQHLLPELQAHVDAGKLILGICNGFQTLVKAGLLPGPPHPVGSATLTWNDSGRFECRWVRLAPNPDAPGPWTKNLPATLLLPMAHAEGKFVASDAVLDDLQAHHQVAFTYADPAGQSTMTYPGNPNGSLRAIAGIVDRTGRIFGMMPHPDRHFMTSQGLDSFRRRPEDHWLPFFANAASYLASRTAATV